MIGSLKICHTLLIGQGVLLICLQKRLLTIILCLEILSNNINTNAMIKGIQINDQEIKQTFFADDAKFVNDGSSTSFETLVETLHTFRKIIRTKPKHNKIHCYGNENWISIKLKLWILYRKKVYLDIWWGKNVMYTFL